MRLSFAVGVPLIGLMLILAVWHGEVFNPQFFTSINRSPDEPMSAGERLYFFNGTSQLSMRFDEYLQYVAKQITPPPTAPIIDNSARLSGENVWVDKILRGRRNGFFIECGAADGSGSQTIFFESQRNWTGLLIEGNRRLVTQLLQRRRKAYVFSGCVTPRHPKHVTFVASGHQGLSEELASELFYGEIKKVGSFESRYSVQCFPLNHLLASIGINHVDFFSFDIQGGEPLILEAMDFNTLRIDVILVEVYHTDPIEKEKSRNKMRELFNKTGLYQETKTLNIDMIFQRKDLWVEK